MHVKSLVGHLFCFVFCVLVELLVMLNYLGLFGLSNQSAKDSEFRYDLTMFMFIVPMIVFVHWFIFGQFYH